MPRDAVLHIVHSAAGGLALAIITVFMASTVLVETLGGPSDIAAVKTAIAWAIPLLVLAMATAGGSGLRLSGSGRAGRAATKIARMRLIGANGLFVLIPSALFLASKAQDAAFDFAFVAVQGLELLAGTVNLILLARNRRDGLALSAHRHAASAGRAA